jgi:radical SAM protein with 4Fe4S-binding SPASM domain
MYGSIKEDAEIRHNPDGAELSTASGKKIFLNHTALDILELLNEGKATNEVAEMLARKYDDTPSRVQEIISKYTHVAIEQGYLSLTDTPLKRNITYSGSKKCRIPRSVSLEMTYACNLRCKHCYVEAGAKQDGELNTTEMLGLLEKLKAAGIKEINVTGGEPLVRNDIFEILDYSFSNFKTVLLTNGYGINEGIGQKLSKYRNMLVQLSLDGANAKTHDHLRGIDGSFDRVLNAMELLSKNGLRAVASMTVTSFNLDQIEDVLKIAKENGAIRFRAGPIIPSGRAKELNWNLSREDMSKFKDKIKELHEKYKNEIFVDAGDTILTEDEKEFVQTLKNCGAGYKLVAIAPNGDVRPCAGLPSDVFYQGNICRESAEDVFGSKMSRFLFDVQSPKKDTCTGCEHNDSCGFCLVSAYALASCKSCSWLENVIIGAKNAKFEGSI